MTARLTLARNLSEADLQKAVLDLATLRGWLVTHFRPARATDERWITHLTGDPGFPDVVVARGGVVRFFEIKTEKGKLTQDQERWRKALDGCDSEDDDWEYLLLERPEIGYAVIRPSRWQSGQVAEALR